MQGHLNRLSRIVLDGNEVPPITMKLAAKDAHVDSGLKLTGKVGCRQCLTALKVLGFFRAQLIQTGGQPWTWASVYWHDDKKLGTVAREILDIPKPVEQREVADLGRIKVLAVDERGEGGANHDYLLLLVDTPAEGAEPAPPKIIGGMQFQKGAVGAEGSRDGITIEALLAVSRDRLDGFQAGPNACAENGMALWHLDMAIKALDGRTAGRVERGVEGSVAP